MNEVTGVVVWITGPRNYPIARVPLPESLVADLPSLLDGARELCPQADFRVAVRAIWRLGCAALRRNREKGIPLVPADLG
jgi:hypothetical protein